MLFERLSKNFLHKIAGEAVYERGLNYFRGGRVGKIWLEDAIIYADVAGNSGNYRVNISDNNGEIDYSCNCPYEGTCCKHVVATSLTFLDQKNEIYQKAKKVSKDQLTLKEQLLKLEKDELVNLLLFSLKTHKDWKSSLLKETANLLEKSGTGGTQQIYEEEFYELLQKATGILAEHNEYGGGPDEDYDEVFELLNEILQLIKDKKLNDNIRREFIGAMIHYYILDNHGMVDMVFETVYETAQSDEDWKFIINKLESDKKGDHKDTIMQIYKDKLHDEKTYLNMRQTQLHFGMDYYDLAIFYKDKGDVLKAVEIAETGVKKSEGDITELWEFLFEYYKDRNYEKALVYAKSIFQDSPGLDKYKWLKKFVKPEEWKDIEPWCSKYLSKDDTAVLNFENKEFDKVLTYVFQKPGYNSDFELDSKEELAGKLITIYPQEMLGYYKEKVEKFVNLTGRENYQRAAKYAQYVKDIYKKYLHLDSGWEEYINNIRSSNPKRPALLDEFKKL